MSYSCNGRSSSFEYQLILHHLSSLITLLIISLARTHHESVLICVRRVKGASLMTPTLGFNPRLMAQRSRFPCSLMPGYKQIRSSSANMSHWNEREVIGLKYSYLFSSLTNTYLLAEGLREEDRAGTGIDGPFESALMSLFERGTVFTDKRVAAKLISLSYVHRSTSMQCLQRW